MKLTKYEKESIILSMRIVSDAISICTFNTDLKKLKGCTIRMETIYKGRKIEDFKKKIESDCEMWYTIYQLVHRS